MGSGSTYGWCHLYIVVDGQLIVVSAVLSEHVRELYALLEPGGPTGLRLLSAIALRHVYQLLIAFVAHRNHASVVVACPGANSDKCLCLLILFLATHPYRS